MSEMTTETDTALQANVRLPAAGWGEWAVGQLTVAIGDARHRAQLLAGRPGAGTPDPGPVVCACFGVGAKTIIEAADKQGCMTVDAIGAALKAGTDCGSCRSEIAALLALPASAPV